MSHQEIPFISFNKHTFHHLFHVHNRLTYLPLQVSCNRHGKLSELQAKAKMLRLFVWFVANFIKVLQIGHPKVNRSDHR